MMTFDDAWKEVTDSNRIPGVLEANLVSSKDYLTNETWAACIVTIADYLIELSLDASEPLGLRVSVCSQLQVLFQVGMLVGMKMERSEEGDGKGSREGEGKELYDTAEAAGTAEETIRSNQTVPAQGRDAGEDSGDEL